MNLLKLYNLDQACIEIGCTREFLDRAVKNNELSAEFFGTEKMLKTTDEELNRFIRERLYKKNKKRLKDAIQKGLFQKALDDVAEKFKEVVNYLLMM